MTRTRFLPLLAPFAAALTACSDPEADARLDTPSAASETTEVKVRSTTAAEPVGVSADDPFAGLPAMERGGSLMACDLLLDSRTYKGPCYGLGDDGGGISVNAVGGTAFFGSVINMSAGPDRNGGYGFSGSRDGTEREFTTTGDYGANCWVGEGFRLCATEPGGTVELPETGLVASIRRAESYAANVMESFREPGPNTLFDDRVFSALPATDARSGRLVRCSVSVVGEYYNGPCYFLAESTGGFSVYRPDAAPFVGATTLVSLQKTDTASGDVRGLTTDGVNSLWGEAVRSDADPACWGGTDFEVCAYAL